MEMMKAPACVDALGVSKDAFLGLPPYAPCRWHGPRISFVDESSARKPPGKSDPGGSENDFEFRIDDPVAMLPADELFSRGKLMPLRTPLPLSSVSSSSPPVSSSEIVLSSVSDKRCSSSSEISASEFCALSPKAPTCSSRWRELLGLKRTHNAKVPDAVPPTKTAATVMSIKAPRSLKQFMWVGSDSKNHRIDSSLLNLPLLSSTPRSGDSETDSCSLSVLSPRMSLSSGSLSCSDHDEPARFSLDLEKMSHSANTNGNANIDSNLLVRSRARVRVTTKSNVRSNARAQIGRMPIRRTLDSSGIPPRDASLDSPRMNSSGKVVFQSLERSSSSPSTFNGGSRNDRDRYYKHREAWRGMERSYSANVRVTPLLNVPVCTLRSSNSKGAIFGLFSAQKKEPTKCGRYKSDRI